MKSCLMYSACPAAAVVLLTTPATAGPDFLEDNFGEAGSLPTSAMKVTGTGSVGKIRGTLAGIGPGEPDFEDMYLIEISDTLAFSATVVLPDKPGIEFDTQLWLFRAGVPGEDGLGLLGNNDAQPGGVGFPGSSRLLPMSDDGTGVEIGPGLYFLAISGFNNTPGNAAGDIFFFNPANPFETSGPDGPGGSTPIEGWSGPGAVGAYTIEVDGVTFIPPDCVVTCPPRSLLEGEACNFGSAGDDTFNGGCNSPVPGGSFSPIECGDVICGQSYFDGALRDTDWYQLDTSGGTVETIFTMTLESEFNAVVGRLENLGGELDCSDGLDFAEFAAPGKCETATVSTALLGPGLYWFFVSTDFSQTVNCHFPNFEPGPDYLFTLDCLQSEPCPWDFDGDLTVGFQDLLQLLSNWGPCPGM